MSTNQPGQWREMAAKIAAHAKADPAFKERILQDPVKTLTAEGLPEQAVSDFLRETGMGDVSSYGDCNIVSCIITEVG